MPKVVDQFLGRLRGKIGDVIFKITHGISYAGRAPLPRPASQDVKSVAARIKFGLANKLGHAVNALPLLNHFWKLYTPPNSTGYKTVMKKVMKKNYAHTTDTGLTDDVTLVPDRGITIDGTSFTLTKNLVTVVLAPIGYADVINLSVEVSFVLNLVLFLKGPISSEDSNFNFIHKVSDVSVLNLTNPLTVEIALDSLDADLYEAYTTRKGFFSLVTLDADGNPVRYSSTIHSV